MKGGGGFGSERCNLNGCMGGGSPPPPLTVGTTKIRGHKSCTYLMAEKCKEGRRRQE